MLLSVRNVRKSFATSDGPQVVLRGISFDLDVGETVALTGESGSGKSTLLHLIGGLDQPDDGQILLNGQDFGTLDDAGRAALRRRDVALVFQQFNLIPSLSVADNLSFHARLGGNGTPAELTELAERLGLSDLLHRFPEQLSGGQQQRVAIGRTLAAQPRLILADEPTGNLDEATGDQVLALMLDLVRDSGAGFLMVTHSDRLASRLSRRLHLKAGQTA